jgi:hypothetical protein
MQTPADNSATAAEDGVDQTVNVERMGTLLLSLG